MKTHLSSTFGNNLADKAQQFQLETQYGHTIQLLANQHTQQPIIALKNKRGQIISQVQLDIQLNDKRLQGVEITQVAYDSETKKLIFIFADESFVQASIQALWDELQQTVIDQLALLKNILTEQHADLSNQASTYSQSLLDQVVASNERSTALVKQDLAQRVASIAETLALLATTTKLEETQTNILNAIGDFSGLDQKTLVALLTAILAQVKEKSTDTLSSELAAFESNVNEKLGFTGDTDTAKAAIQTVISKLGLTSEQTVSDLITDIDGKVANIRGDDAATLAQINTAITHLASSKSLSDVLAKIDDGASSLSDQLDTLTSAVQNALNGAVAAIQGGKQGQTKQTLSSLSGDLSNFDKRLEFIVTMLANKPTLSIIGNSISVPTYYLVGEETTIPVRAETSRTLKADELLKVSLKTVSSTLDGAKDSDSKKTPDEVSYTTNTSTDTENLTITATLTKTNPYDSNEKFVIATASKTVYRAYKVYYGYAAGTEADPAPDDVAGLTEKIVYSTYGTCDIPANPSVGGKYLYIFVPNAFGETAGKLSISSGGFTYNWKATSTITGYYMYKSAETLNSHDKISLIQ